MHQLNSSFQCSNPSEVDVYPCYMFVCYRSEISFCFKTCWKRRESDLTGPESVLTG